MNQDKPLRVRLCESRGSTSVFIDAEITDDGSLQLSGQDVGEAPAKWWGDDDYEYWVHVRPENKDRVLLALLEKLYAGNSRADTEFADLLKAKGIPYEFDSYV
jgi:hypothetical protein